MSAYDSDSSGADDNDYTETNVLLGYATKEDSDDTISQLGGRPTWLDSTSPPSAALAKCKVCNDPMVLLLQLNGDLPEFFPGHERRLYVFSCRRNTCRRREGSVRAIRGVRVSEVPVKKSKEKPKESENVTKQPVEPYKGLGEKLFGVHPLNGSSSNPFSISNSAFSNPFSTFTPPSSNPFAAPSTNAFPSLPTQKEPETTPESPISYTELNQSFASKVSLDSPSIGPIPTPEPWPSEDILPKPYTHYHIGEADYEVLDKDSNRVPIPQATQIMDLEEESSSSKNQKEDKNAYEDTGDIAFLKFSDRLGQNPEQVIRYEFKGQPLVYSKTDAVGRMFHHHTNTGKISTSSSGSAQDNTIPRCGNCGAARVFEVQLCPHAISELEADEEGLDGMEWTVIAVAVCEKDCVPRGVGMREVGYVEEAALVQWEIPK